MIFLLLVKVSENKIVNGERCEVGGVLDTYMELLRQGEEHARIPNSDSHLLISLSSQGYHVLPQDGDTKLSLH